VLSCEKSNLASPYDLFASKCRSIPALLWGPQLMR
jgi:hypothetical protein